MLLYFHNGVTINNYGHTEIQSSIFEKNTGITGGALHVIGHGLNSSTAIRRCSFYHNTAQYGGSIFFENTEVYTEDVYFTNSSAKQNGGGIYLKSGTYTSKNTTYTNNTAELGGSIFVQQGSLKMYSANFSHSKANSGGTMFMKIGNFRCSSCIFMHNSALYGGVVYMEKNHSILHIKKSKLIKNSASAGGVFHVKHGTICISGSKLSDNNAHHIGAIGYMEQGIFHASHCTFRKQKARKFGGVLYIVSAIITIYFSVFQCNHAIQGGVVYSPYGSANITISNSRHYANSASQYGAITYMSRGHVKILNSTFINNYAKYGGVALIEKGTLSDELSLYKRNNASQNGGVFHLIESTAFVLFSSFEYNTAMFGAINYVENTNSNVSLKACIFNRNRASVSGGVIFALNIHMLHITNGSHFLFNSANHQGGAVAFVSGNDLSLSTLTIQDSIFVSNSAFNGGAVYSESVAINIHRCEFSNNAADHSGGALMVSKQSRLEAHEEIVFTNNSGTVSGGAIFLSSSRLIIAGEGTKLYFYRNSADNGTGGAIFFRDHSYTFVCYSSDKSEQSCILNFLPKKDILSNQIYSDGNRAMLGSFLYGGLFYRCSYKINGFDHHSLSLLKNITHSSESMDKLSISSDPVKACHCVAMIPDCSYQHPTISVWRGETFSISLAALDQNGNMVDSNAISGLDDYSIGEINPNEYNQVVHKHCTDLSFHISSASIQERIHIFANGPCKDADRDLIVTVDISLKPGCPIGFQGEGQCGCDNRLSDIITNICYIDNQTMRISDFKYWFNFINKSLVYSYCPFDYCLRGEVLVPAGNSDSQCSSKRSGVLCGSCSKNFSRLLGAGNCDSCVHTKAYLWLILLFIVAGILLIFTLLICRLTVSIGTINGLIFYANVVSINRADYFGTHNYSPFTVFIDWLNLDFGIQTCFYDGLNTYEWVWLQYMFPLYMCSLIITVIVATHKSSGVMKILGRNLIPVLSTLILLAYTKLVKTIILSLSAASLYKSENEEAEFSKQYSVWKLDGNIRYLQGKHIPLFSFAVVLFSLFLVPYTVLLIVGQCLQRLPRKRGLLWIHGSAMIAFLDSYQAPYHKIHRFWIGVTLLSRWVFLILALYQTEYFDNIRVNLMSTILILLLMLVYKWIVVGPVYRNRFIDKLEDVSLFNLLLLTSMIYCLESRKAKGIVVNTSVGITIINFLVIMFYHGYLQFREHLLHRLISRNTRRENNDLHTDNDIVDVGGATRGTKVSQTFVDLREPLLDTM